MKKLIFFVIVAVIIPIVASRGRLATVSPSEASTQFQQTNKLNITNLTHAFFVVSAVRDGDIARMTFRNDYDKTINGFTLSGGANSGVQVDLLSSEHEIAPREIYQYRFFASNLDLSASQAKPLNIAVLNVVFEDGTGDGDEQATAMIYNRRLGESAAFDRLMPVLDPILNTSTEIKPEHIRQLKERIVAACGDLQKEQPLLVRGIKHAEARLIGDIEQIERAPTDSKNELAKEQLIRLKQHYQREAARLRQIQANPHQN